jgi:hypothetical protein
VTRRPERNQTACFQTSSLQPKSSAIFYRATDPMAALTHIPSLCQVEILPLNRRRGNERKPTLIILRLPSLRAEPRLGTSPQAGRFPAREGGRK